MADAGTTIQGNLNEQSVRDKKCRRTRTLLRLLHLLCLDVPPPLLLLLVLFGCSFIQKGAPPVTLV